MPYRNMEEIVKEAYGWLAGKHQNGDEYTYSVGLVNPSINSLPGDDNLVRFLPRCLSSQDSCGNDI